MLQSKTEALTFSAVILALGVIPLLEPPRYFLFLLVLFLIYVILSSSWSLIGVCAGQVNLGHAAFFGAGAYGAAIAATGHLDFLASVVIGGFWASLVAIVASVMFRLKGQYFAIGTLALSEAARVTMNNWEIVGGAGGILVPAAEGRSILANYYLALVLTIVEAVILSLLMSSHFGLALRAIRNDEFAAESLGVNPMKYKALSLVVSAFFAGLAGAIYAFQMLFIEPDSVFGVLWTAIPIVMVILGGKGTLLGPMLGAGVFLSLGELLAPLGEISSIVTGGILIVFILFFRPGAIFGAGRQWNSLSGKPARKSSQ